MQPDELIINQILGPRVKARVKVKELRPLEHPGSSSIKIFTIKGERTKYLLKSYSEQKYTDRETKNFENINCVTTFNKPRYFGKYKSYFIQEYISGILFQKLIKKLSFGQ